MADDIEIAIYAYLQTRAGLTSLVGTRIYENRVPEGAAVPYVIYSRIGAAHEQVLEGHLGGCAARYQFDVFGSSGASVAAVRKQLFLAFNAIPGTRSSVAVHSAWALNDWSDYDSEVGKYRASMDFEITFIEDLT